MVDWTFVWVLAVCGCLLGALEAYEEAVTYDVPSVDFQKVVLVLEEEIEPRERMNLRTMLHMLGGVSDVRWLSQEEVVKRVLRQDLDQDQVALIEEEVPQVIEILVPTSRILNESLQPNVMKNWSGVADVRWDEDMVAMLREEDQRWKLRTAKMYMGLLIGAVVIVAAAFLLNSQRNQLRLACEHAHVRWETYGETAPIGGIYLGTLGTWLKAMAAQALATVVIAFCIFAVFSNLLATVDTAPEESLLSAMQQGFLWATAAVAFVTKGLDLLRVSLRHQRLVSRTASLRIEALEQSKSEEESKK